MQAPSPPPSRCGDVGVMQVSELGLLQQAIQAVEALPNPLELRGCQLQSGESESGMPDDDTSLLELGERLSELRRDSKKQRQEE